MLTLMLAACNSRQRKQPSAFSIIDADQPMTSDGQWMGMEDFDVIKVSGVSKVVVFVRDSLMVKIDGEDVKQGDERVHIQDGVLTIAPKDTLKESHIKSVRIYTPRLKQYVVHDCAEANISGDTLAMTHFTLDVKRTHLFRGNACLKCDKIDISLSKMLMAKFDVQAATLNVQAERMQHLELKGKAQTLLLKTYKSAAAMVDKTRLTTIKEKVQH